MTHSKKNATAVASRYEDVSLRFKRHFRDAYEKLQDRVGPLKKNAALAEALRQRGRHSVADRLSKCGCQVVGNDPNELLPSYYCKQMFWCRNCMFLLAMHRREQWVEANERFARAINCEELVLNRYLIRPYTLRATNCPDEDLYLAAKLVVEFKRQLSLFHRSYNIHQFLAGKLAGKTACKQKEQLLGPTRTAIHIVPSLAQKNSHGMSFIHLHATVITPRQVRVKKLTTQIESLWDKAKSITGIRYRPGIVEVSRHNEMDPDHDLFERQYRPCHFPVFQREHSATAGTAKHLAYLGLPFKTNWEAESLIQAHDLIDWLDIQPRSLNQSLGMMGVYRRQLPCEFNVSRLRPAFVANLAGDEWAVQMRRVVNAT